MKWFTKKSDDFQESDLKSIDNIHFEQIFSISYYGKDKFVLSEECDNYFMKELNKTELVEICEELFEWIKQF